MTDREAMQMALEALNLPSMKTQQMLQQRDAAIATLRAQLEQPEQDPVAWMAHKSKMLPTFHRTFVAAQGWADNPTPLYTAPPQRKPLTDELYNELLFAVGKKYSNETRHQTALRYIRQAEMPSSEPAKAAHGIGETP